MQLFDLTTMSVHLGEEYGAVEVEAKDLTPNQLSELQSRVDEIILANLPVEVLFIDSDQLDSVPLRKISTRKGTLRIIKIGEFDYSACGGTHCRSTAEVGMIKITGTEKIRGRTQIKFLSGVQAFMDYRDRFAVTDSLSRQLTCHPNDLFDKVEKMAVENKALRKELAEAQRELLPARARSLAEKAEIYGGKKLLFEEIGAYDQRLASQLAGLVANRIDGVTAVMLGARLIIATSETSALDAGALARRLSEQTDLKGGGNKRLAQMGGGSPGSASEYKNALIKLIADDQE